MKIAIRMIVDASVAVKWFVDEEGADYATDLSRVDLIAPDLIYAEVANALWKKRKRGEISGPIDPLARMDRLLAQSVPIAPLADRAVALSQELDHPVYKCFYLALAILERRPMVTADERFLRRCRATPYDANIRPLAEWRSK